MTDKWGRRLFNAGAFWLLLVGFVDGSSLFERPVPANDTERRLLDLMTNYKFNLMGSIRSVDNRLRGFSIVFMLSAFAIGALALALSRERSAVLKRVALANSIWLLAMTAVSFHYFFIAPTRLLAAALLLFASAWLKLPAET